MFLITVGEDISPKKEIFRVFDFQVKRESDFTVINQGDLRAVFFNCKKINLPKYTVFINGFAFPEKGENLDSALEKSIQAGNGENFLNGNFSLVVFNKDTERNDFFMVINDRHGTVPCFFSQENKKMRISSIFQLFFLDQKLEFNESALLDYLSLGYVLPDESLWKPIKTLPKGKFLTVHPSKKTLIIQNKEEEKIKRRQQSFKNLRETALFFFEELKSVINDGIQKAHVGAMLLTGGSDTRILLSCIEPEKRNQLFYLTFNLSLRHQSDVLTGELLAKALNLKHKVIDSLMNQISEYPKSWNLTFRHIYNDNLEIGGIFGSELFGMGFFIHNMNHLFIFSERLDFFKAELLKIITVKDYERIGSPWKRLNNKILLDKERKLILETLLRSQFSSLYSEFSHDFIIPSVNHHLFGYYPFIDTRIIDFFLSCPREFLLNFSLYDYILTHFSEKTMREIPFCSNITKYTENFQSMDNKNFSDKVKATPNCDYRAYFERDFSPSLFEGTFLARLKNTDVDKIPWLFLLRICNLNCFLLEISKR